MSGPYLADCGSGKSIKMTPPSIESIALKKKLLLLGAEFALNESAL